MRFKNWHLACIIIGILFIIIVNLLQGAEHSISYSARSSILPAMPFDYEFRYSFISGKDRYIVLYEREVGLYGWGVEVFRPLPISIKLNDKKVNTNFEWYMRGVEQINYQNCRFTMPLILPHFRYDFGFSINADSWSDAKFMGSAIVRFDDIFTFIVDTNFSDRDVVSLVLKKKVYLDKAQKYYIMPKAEFRCMNEQDFYWIKTIVGRII